MMRILARLCGGLLLALAFALPAAAQGKADPQNTLILETTQGPVVIALRPDLAPKHAERLKTLAREGFYNDVPFHRVIAGFMAQTGDGERGDGTGGSKYADLPAEFSNVPFKRGVVGMARAASPNSANSQFFIMLNEAPSLNGQYTVVGEVVSGMDNVDKIKKGPAALNGAVTNPDRIVKAKVGG
ncbi:peptidylprolyl isomerase [Xanthobacter sp. TB0139]|uniref:peptidylprolyl isomerase n=1 Tax=Xanthobacter sp. TB0139 TaxID=3459178 RepID=UPI004039CABD